MDQFKNTKEWLIRAHSNLNRAKDSDNLEQRGIVIEDLCFDAQQCIEKSIKAVLVQNEIEFPYTHDISKLITLLKKNSIKYPDELLEAAELTVYAFITRYPGERKMITNEDLNCAVKIAEKVYYWAKNIIGTSD